MYRGWCFASVKNDQKRGETSSSRSVGRSVGRLVGRCQRVSRSMKFVKGALNNNVTVFYVLCIRFIFSAYCRLCIVATIIVMHSENDAKNTEMPKHTYINALNKDV